MISELSRSLQSPLQRNTTINAQATANSASGTGQAEVTATASRSSGGLQAFGNREVEGLEQRQPSSPQIEKPIEVCDFFLFMFCMLM